MNDTVTKNPLGQEVLRLHVSGSIILSVVHLGDGEFDIAVVHHGKLTGDILLCEWHELFEIYDEVRNGVFRRFPRFHTRLMQEM